jgi:hypothetical protein
VRTFSPEWQLAGQIGPKSADTELFGPNIGRTAPHPPATSPKPAGGGVLRSTTAVPYVTPGNRPGRSREERNNRFLTLRDRPGFRSAPAALRCSKLLQTTGATCVSCVAGDAGDCDGSKRSTLAAWVREAGGARQPLIPVGQAVPSATPGSLARNSGPGTAVDRCPTRQPMGPREAAARRVRGRP